jgi:hypothetical protein
MSEEQWALQVHCKCKHCAHVWHALTLPLPVDQFCAVTRALHCPMCAADSSQIVLLSQPRADER